MSGLKLQLKTPNGISYEQPTGLFINGEFVKGKSGKTFEVIAPYNEEVIANISEAEPVDVDVAVDAAEEAFKTWGHSDTETRARVLFKLADLIEQKTELFAAVESWDNGKTIAMATGDVGLVVSTFRNYGGWATKITGDTIETDADHFTYTRREPVGVCGMVIPWNFPLLMLSWKIAPALACGCTMILKSAESTPLTALLFASLLNEAGVPKGVVNIISGYGPAGAALASHSRIHKIAFTGSTATGRKIMESAAKSNVKNITLELGGKSPNLFFDDCDFDKSVKLALAAIFYNSGEVCSAGSRVYIQEGIYDKFLAALKTEVEKLKVGSPFDKDNYYGAQTNKLQFDKVMDYIQKGVEEGAQLVTGGKRIGNKGYYITPTIFADVSHSHTIATEEIFGPVLAVFKFKTVDEAIALANSSEYGLGSGIHTESLDRAIYVAHRLRAGSVWVNTYNDFHPQVPFGGYGTSGIGRELGKEVLENFTETKAIRIAGILGGRL